MDQPLKVLVAGTGFAGRGHAQAFRAAGAQVVGMVGRTPEVVRDVTNDLSIPFGGTDWPAALAVLQPDIVAIATPGGAHYAPIKQAIDAGCHVFCDKPLAHSAEIALELDTLARVKGVKTAFAASFQYAPSVQYAKRLVAEGDIGEPTEVESISHFNLERGIPFGWSHRAETGGGRLNNNFTHSIAIVTAVIGDNVLQICGDVRDDLGQAPVVKGVHDFTKRRAFIPDDLDDPNLEWGESNVEWSYTVMARLASDMASKPVSALFKHGGLVPRFHEDHVVFYGTKGALYLKGHYGTGPLYRHDGDDWVELPLPQNITERIPNVDGETEQCWHVLADLFVRDIRGKTVEPYPTFREGSRYQNFIDIIRRSETWVDVSQLT